jgi:drug/metabolite transporter (DMT)-like permease
VSILGSMANAFSMSLYQSRKKLTLKAIPLVMYFSLFGSVFAFILNFLFSAVFHVPFVVMPNLDAPFVLSMLYSATISSAVAYTFSYILVSKIGATRTSYATLISPIFAMVVSAFFEGYTFTILSFVGISFVMFAEYFALKTRH